MKKLISLFLAFAMVFALAACGSGNSESAQGITEDTVYIGNIMPTSGAMAGVGVPFVAGIQAYLDMVNSEGGIDGRKIELVHIDDEFDPVKGKAALEKLVEDEKVFAIVAPFGTPVVGAILPDVKSYGIPFLFPATGIRQLYSEHATTNEEGYNVFPVQPLYITEGQLMVARGVGTFGAKKIGMIYTNDDAGKDMLEGAQAQAEALGVELVYEQVAVSTADASAAVLSVLSEDVDFVIIGAIQATMPTIVKELVAQGNTVPAIGSCVCGAITIAEQFADVIEGQFDVYISSWKSHDEEDYGEDNDLFETWVPSEYHGNADADSGWIAGYIFCEGLRRLEGKDVTWASYMAALESTPMSIPFSGTLDYTNGQRVGITEMLLSKCNINDPSGTGWEVVYPMASMEEMVSEQ